MASNAALQQYIVAQQKLGKNEAEIKTVLLAQGWSVAMIEEEFALLKGETAPTPPAASAAPGQTVATTESTSTGMTVLTILLLFFVTPIGLIVMWVGTKWSKTAKWVLTILLGILPLIAIIGIMIVGILVAVNPSAQISKAKTMATLADARQIINAAKLYQIDNQVFPPSVSALIESQILPASFLEEGSTRASFDLVATNNGKDCELTVKMTDATPVMITCSEPDYSALSLPSTN